MAEPKSDATPQPSKPPTQPKTPDLGERINALESYHKASSQALAQISQTQDEMGKAIQTLAQALTQLGKAGATGTGGSALEKILLKAVGEGGEGGSSSDKFYADIGRRMFDGVIEGFSTFMGQAVREKLGIREREKPTRVNIQYGDH